MIIAVDFDDTLRFTDGTPNTHLITRLKGEQKRGAIVILWTCRTGKSLVDALLYLRQFGFTPNLVNQNTWQTISALGYDPRKILADVYIDDKNLLLKLPPR